MENFKKLNLDWLKILKIFGLVILAVVILSLVTNLVVGPVFSQFKNYSAGKAGIQSSSLSYPSAAIDNYKYQSDTGLSLRNIAGSEAEGAGAGNYEVMEYNATIETGKLDKDCALIAGLKAKDYVIFENSNSGEKSCNFRFKVEKDKVEEILGIIAGLNPRDLSQNIESIKKRIEDFTSQEEILKNKQSSIDDTLKNAISAYNEITVLATKTNNADSLAKVIDSKINILERLTNERLQVSAQLENLARIKAEQLDRVKYTNFYVYIYENKIFDSQYLKDSWILSAKQFVNNINQTLKDLSLGLLAFVLLVVKYLIYIFLALIIVKYCWKFGKRIWKK